jgi:hypothetical protein
LDLTYDFDRDVQEAAVGSLRFCQIEPQKVGGALAKVATDAEHPGRQSALGYLCAWTTNADLTRPVFLVGIRDTNPAIWRLAVKGLASMQADHVIELLDPCVKDPDRAIRIRAVASLRRFTNQVSEASARLRAALS